MRGPEPPRGGSTLLVIARRATRGREGKDLRRQVGDELGHGRAARVQRVFAVEHLAVTEQDRTALLGHPDTLRGRASVRLACSGAVGIERGCEICNQLRNLVGVEAVAAGEHAAHEVAGRQPHHEEVAHLFPESGVDDVGDARADDVRCRPLDGAGNAGPVHHAERRGLEAGVGANLHAPAERKPLRLYKLVDGGGVEPPAQPIGVMQFDLGAFTVGVRAGEAGCGHIGHGRPWVLGGCSEGLGLLHSGRREAKNVRRCRAGWRRGVDLRDWLRGAREERGAGEWPTGGWELRWRVISYPSEFQYLAQGGRFVPSGCASLSIPIRRHLRSCIKIA